MLQGEFRYLTDGFGAGQIWGGILPSDKEYDDKDRKDFHFYNWDINDQWSTNLEYNYASDKDYFSDLDSSPISKQILTYVELGNLTISMVFRV